MSDWVRDMAACPTVEAVASCALRHARRVTDTGLGNVQLIDWKVGYLEIVAQDGFDDEFLACFRRVRETDGTACGRAIFLRKAVVIDDVMEDRGFMPYRTVAERSGFRAVRSIPLLSSSGALYGVVSTHSAQVRRLTNGQISALSDIATCAANRITRLKAERAWPELSRSGTGNGLNPRSVAGPEGWDREETALIRRAVAKARSDLHSYKHFVDASECRIRMGIASSRQMIKDSREIIAAFDRSLTDRRFADNS